MHEAGGPPQAAECLRPYAGTTTTNLLRYLEVGVAAALEAGRLIAAAFHQPKAVTTKQGPVDLVTETDQAAELAIFGIIREAFPSHAFIGEEASAAQGGPAAALTDEPTWMVDPLDGEDIRGQGMGQQSLPGARTVVGRVRYIHAVWWQFHAPIPGGFVHAPVLGSDPSPVKANCRHAHWPLYLFLMMAAVHARA